MKSCTKQSKCNGEPKPLSEFHKDKNRPDGHKHICKECISEHNSDKYYWSKNFKESYEKFNFNRKRYFKEKYPKLNYGSFTKYIIRRFVTKLSEMTKQDIDDAVSAWLGNGFIKRSVV
jgi:hypothetical protein